MRGFREALLMVVLVVSTATVSADWSPRHWISRSASPARLQYNFGWAVDVDGAGVVHAVWLELDSEQPAGHGTGRVMYSRSPNDGRSWTSPAALSGSPRPVTGHPRVAAAGPHVYVAWHGLQDGSGVPKIYLLRSSDHGSTWHAPLIVSDNVDATWAATWPSVNACGNAVHVVWPDARSGVPEIHLRSSSDAGASWGAVRQVSAPDGRSSWVPSVACREAEVHVAWSDERHNVDETGAPYDCGIAGDSGRCREEEYYRRSTDFGESWEPEVRLTHDAGTPRPSWAPSIAVEGDTVHVVFFDARTDRFQVYYKRSTGAGAPSTWEPARRISHDDGATIHARPVIAARGEDLHVVWFGITPQVGASVFYVTSGDGGTTFGRPVALTPRAIRVEAHPSVAASPRGSAHVIWYQPDDHGADQIAHRARRAPRSGREAGSAPAWD